MKKIIYLIVFLLLINLVYGATIHGKIYDLDLNKVGNVVIEVNSTPQQRMISKDGVYSINLGYGSYKVTARHMNAGSYYTEEKIEVTKDGDYVLDLFLFPSFEDENELTEDTNISIEANLFETKTSYLIYLITFIILILIILIFRFKRKDKPKEIKKETKEAEKQDLNEVIETIKKQGGRTTQKEIRKQIPLSEAKISLMIAELESKGKIRKIKKGRGNIIILNE